MAVTDRPVPLAERPLDVVVFGASGFVGRLVASHLARCAPPGTRIALAGRSLQRLGDVRDGLGSSAADWPLIVADSGDPTSLGELARATKVVATTVGPYARFGLPLVEACAAAGTSTCDLTGEVLFVRRCIDRVEAVAGATGARIVSSCGFDSIPSDLGVLMTAEQARADGQGELRGTTLVVRSMRGGVSGGTIDSMRGQMAETRSDPTLRSVLSDPYALSPDREREPDRSADGKAPGAGRGSSAPRDRAPLVGRDRELGGWFGPFVMAPFNTRIVRRSNALHGWAYGRGFRYREVQGLGGSPAGPVLAAGLTAGLAALAAALSFAPGRAVVNRVLPSPGQGPSERVQRTGHFTVEIHARTATGARYLTTVSAQGDPGYAATSVMLGQSALCLALDRLPAVAGVLTPRPPWGWRWSSASGAPGSAWRPRAGAWSESVSLGAWVGPTSCRVARRPRRWPAVRLTGIAFVMRALGRQEASERAFSRVRGRFDGQKWNEMFELFVGNAGIGLGALHAGDLDLAVLALTPYLTSPDRMAGGVKWRVGMRLPRTASLSRTPTHPTGPSSSSATATAGATAPPATPRSSGDSARSPRTPPGPHRRAR